MTFNVAMLEAMRAEGLDLDACIRILSAGEKRTDPTAAERQQRRREKVKAERDMSQRDVTRDGSPNEYISNPSDQITSEANASSVARPKNKRARKTKIPEDWQPLELTAGTVAWDIVQTWEPGRIERELSKFRDHHTSRGTLMDDWQAAWRSWITKSQEFENRNGRLQPAAGTRPDSLVADYRRALEEERAGLDQETDPGTWPALPSLGPGRIGSA